ncbi:MAG: helix-turn-helix domain-containing protein [Pseudonocardiaceae bacterium]
MLGDAKLGAVLRELREGRELTLAAVARQAGCVESTVSYVECGHRRLKPWLAQEFDRIYETGGVIAALASGVGDKPHQALVSEASGSDVFIVLLPVGGVSVPLSRRELLTSLSVGIVSGRLQGQFELALAKISPSDDLLKHFEDSFNGFRKAVRMLPPQQLMDGLSGNVAILDGLRRRAAKPDRQRYCRLQARYAESLGWLSEEAGDLSSATYWIDRASQWAQAANWSAMTEYGFVRRSMMVISFSGDGRRAIDQAHHVFEISDASPRMKGLAANQMAFGYALTGNRDASCRALDKAMNWLAQPAREDDTLLGQRSVVDEDLFAIFQATCDIYLGCGASAIRVLEPRMVSLSRSSVRTATITRAKLARAYAQAGQPAEACRLSWETLHAMEHVDSLSARSQLRRTVRVLDQWHGRSDVQDLTHRLGSPTLTT